ncbi:MAG TPA: hypothetical protein VGT24_10485 [Candidatus Acidoferrales bacterium]|nr:hypothetical protein [Candidatus Acidoferrales bacterium]
MKTKTAILTALWLVAPLLFAQTSNVITMDQEPHHHLALHNAYVKVFNVEVSPGDSIILHRHDQDTIAIAIGEQLVTVGIPGKPDVHQKNADAQVRLQRGGYMHSTRVDGDTQYHTIAVELLHPQTNFHNVCAEVLPGQPLNCPDAAAKASSAFASQALLESNETRVRLVRIPPHQSANLGEVSPAGEAPQLIVALDAASISSKSRQPPIKSLQPGDFEWIEGGHNPARVLQNSADKEARFIEILPTPQP